MFVVQGGQHGFGPWIYCSGHWICSEIHPTTPSSAVDRVELTFAEALAIKAPLSLGKSLFPASCYLIVLLRFWSNYTFRGKDRRRWWWHEVGSMEDYNLFKLYRLDCAKSAFSVFIIIELVLTNSVIEQRGEWLLTRCGCKFHYLYLIYICNYPL